MKLKNLFETQEKNLVGLKIDQHGRVSDPDIHVTGTYVEVNAKNHAGSFFCDNLNLTSLYGAPKNVSGAPGLFDCAHNSLTSLEFAPRTVSGSFRCSNNEIKSLDHCPERIGGNFIAYANKIESLKDVHKRLKHIDGYMSFELNPVKSHILGVMLIPGLRYVYLDNEPVQNIINHGIKNKKHWTEVQAELEEAGFEEYAQL